MGLAAAARPATTPHGSSNSSMHPTRLALQVCAVAAVCSRGLAGAEQQAGCFFWQACTLKLPVQLVPSALPA
jgi:hypothetical protein